MKRILLFVATLLLASQADACWRCGRYSTACRYYVTPVASAVAVPAVTNVFVAQNVYPSTIGQGATNYVAQPNSYSAAVAHFFDPNAYLAGVLEVQKDGQRLLASSMTRADGLAQGFATIQASAVEKLAHGQSAALVLNAAGLTYGAETQQASSSAVVVKTDAFGRVQVVPLDPSQALSGKPTNDPTPNTPPKPGPSPDGVPGDPNDVGALTRQFCGKCHGFELNDPKGGLYLGDDPVVAATMRTKFFDIVQAVSAGTMPPEGQAKPSKEEKARLLNELEAIIKKHEPAKRP